ncbi:MAG: flagellar export protein FliJ [Gammaproteobacteria bacterium]|nr:flagellar export protein FliJ [Gammaproteobacteria bacterium]
MKRSERIRQLKKLVDREAEQEAIKLAEIQAQLSGEQSKISQLEAFRDDYFHRSANTMGQVRPSQLQDLEKFTQQLDYSISQQLQYITVMSQHLEAQRARWLSFHNKVKAYEQWIEKLCLEELALERRQEQKLLDAFVINQWHRK